VAGFAKGVAEIQLRALVFRSLAELLFLLALLRPVLAVAQTRALHASGELMFSRKINPPLKYKRMQAT
jgi:hypothetical protein